MGKCYAFTAARGGMGQSTVCASLSLALAEKRRRVLTADLDTLSPSLDLLFGIGESTVYTFADYASGAADFATATMQPPIAPGVSVLPAALGADVSPEEALGAIEKIKAENKDAFLLLDMPSPLLPSLREAVDGVILLVRPDEISLRSAEYFVTTVDFLPQTDAFFLLNHVSFVKETAKLEPPLLDIIDRVGLPLLGVLPDIWAWHCQLPTFDKSYKKTAYARCVRNIAARLCGEQVPLLQGIHPEGFSRRYYIER